LVGYARGLAEAMLTAGYELEELIGRWWHGWWYFAPHDVRLHRTVALKIVAPRARGRRELQDAVH